MSHELVITLIGIGATLVGWLLVQLWNLFKETRDDVKKLLLESSARNEKLSQIEKDISDIYEISEKHDHRLQKVENHLEIIIQNK